MSNFPPYERPTNLKHVATRQSNNTASLNGKLADVQSRVTQAYREAAAASVLFGALERIGRDAQALGSQRVTLIADEALEAYRQAISSGE